MNKEQIIEYYRRFSQWQQAAPQYANRHKDSVRHCQNCGTEFSDNFCPRCSQRAEVGRVGWNSIKESVALLWGMDSRSFAYTLFQLLTRPGYLVRDYISGRRQVSFPPVKMLVIVSLFAFIFESVFHLDNEILTLHTNLPEIDNIMKWFNKNKSWGTLFYQSFFILPTWVVFRFAPGYPRHTLPEGFFLQIFLSTLSLLLAFLDYLNENAENVIASIYFVVAYHQLFGYSWWGTLWRCVATALTAILTMIPVMFAVLFFFDTSLEEYLWVLVASVAAIVVILVASYRISLKKSRQRL
jgi:hypothetical protein